MTSIVIAAGAARSRGLVNTADSAARHQPCEIVIAIQQPGYPKGIVESLADRHNAAAVCAATFAGAVNKAIARTQGEYVLLVHSPWLLDRGIVERCCRLLEDEQEDAAVIPAVQVRSTDGRQVKIVGMRPTLESLVADPHATPPVTMMRRSSWERIGSLDESAGDLAACDWWLRVLASGLPIAVVAEPLVTLTAGGTEWWPRIGSEPLDLAAYRRLLEKHRPLLERDMTALLIERETAFGRLMEQHREALRVRDDNLRELERLRAETAHHHAYLRHHGYNAIDWGDLRRSDPVSREWGYDRGVPIDRPYIAAFLSSHSSDITGAVLEVQEDDFSRRFGGPRVDRSVVVDLDDGNPRATVVTDLRRAAALGDAQFDCIILTQTLHVIDDMSAVVRECYRLLKPAGVLLATLPCASRVCLEYGERGDLWRVTAAGARALFEPVFDHPNVDVVTYGSVLTNVAFLHGLASDELTDSEFDNVDPYHPVLVGVRAWKSAAPALRAGSPAPPGVVLLYHRLDDCSDVHDLSVPAELFEEQLSWLASKCRVMPLEELLIGARQGLPPRAVAITFDDGYLDTLEVAAPLLQRFGLPATVFATSRWLDETGEYWWDALERALLGGQRPPSLSLDLREMRMTFGTGTNEERRAAHDRIHSHLVHASLDERDCAIAQIAAWAGSAPDLRRRPMMADELRQWANLPGLSVGAHGVNHVALPDQPANVQRDEITHSVAALERVLGRRVETFAHPYGAVDRTTSELARVTCRWSLGCDPAPVGASFDAARVPRLEVKRGDGRTLAARLERWFKVEAAYPATSPSRV